MPVVWWSRALRAFLDAANWWFESSNDECFVFRSHIFVFKIFPKIAFTTQGKLLLLNCPLLSKFDKLFFNSRDHFVVRANFHNCVN